MIPFQPNNSNLICYYTCEQDILPSQKPFEVHKKLAKVREEVLEFEYLSLKYLVIHTNTYISILERL